MKAQGARDVTVEAGDADTHVARVAQLLEHGRDDPDDCANRRHPHVAARMFFFFITFSSSTDMHSTSIILLFICMECIDQI